MFVIPVQSRVEKRECIPEVGILNVAKQFLPDISVLDAEVPKDQEVFPKLVARNEVTLLPIVHTSPFEKLIANTGARPAVINLPPCQGVTPDNDTSERCDVRSQLPVF